MNSRSCGSAEGEVLLRLAQEALGLVRLALLRKHACQVGLGLGELAMLAERGEQADRLAQELLGALEVAPLEGHVGHAGQRVREQRRVADLGEQLAGLLVGRLRPRRTPSACDGASQE